MSISHNIIGNDVGLQLIGIKHNIIKNGVKQLTLRARSIHVDKKGEKAIVDYPNIEFFSENGEIFFLSARKGLVDTISNNINVSGDVCGYSKNYIIKTEWMGYDPNTLSLISGESTVFFGDDLRVRADNIVVNLINKLIRFSGNVESVFNNKIPI